MTNDDALAPLEPMHPGEFLREEFLTPLGITPYRLAKDLGLNRPSINNLVLGRRRVNSEIAALLGKYFGTSATFWLNFQNRYDRDLCDADEEFQARLAAVQPRQANG